MEQNNFFKIFSIFAFVVLMGVSCWATVESLHLLLPSWPILLFWAVTVIFFVVASLGTLWIVNSLNSRIIPNEHRGWKLIGGIILLLAFWVCFSLPTNTHTFFYKSEVTPVLLDELEKTKHNLELLNSGGNAIKMIEEEKAIFTDKVNNAFTRVKDEIMDKNNIGFGDKAKRALLDLQTILGDNVVFQEPKFIDSEQGRRNCIANLQSQKDAFLKSKLETIYGNRLETIKNELAKAEIDKQIQAIQNIQNHIQLHPTDHKEPSQATVDVLIRSFSIISKFSDYLVDKDKTKDKLVHEFELPKTKRLLSVFDVWKDFFNGRFAGRGFGFWIMLGALVDIAGFIFFDLAFRNRN